MIRQTIFEGAIQMLSFLLTVCLQSRRGHRKQNLLFYKSIGEIGYTEFIKFSIGVIPDRDFSQYNWLILCPNKMSELSFIFVIDILNMTYSFY